MKRLRKAFARESFTVESMSITADCGCYGRCTTLCSCGDTSSYYGSYGVPSAFVTAGAKLQEKMT